MLFSLIDVISHPARWVTESGEENECTSSPELFQFLARDEC